MNEPAAEHPTWEDALAHAEERWERGEDVRIYERLKSVEIFDDNGKLVSTESFPPPGGQA